MKKVRLVSALCIVMFSMVFVMSIRLVPSANAEYVKKECMPDFGQHSKQWCWVAAAANCFYWLAKHGYPELLDDPAKPGLDAEYNETDSDSKDPSKKDWHCDPASDKGCGGAGCGKGYKRLLKEICKDGDAVHEDKLVWCSRFFKEKPGWSKYTGKYVECLKKFIKDQGLAHKLEVHTYDKPTFEDYKKEIKRCQDVIILYQWGDEEQIHLVTGYSYNTDKSPPEIEVADPGSSHNNEPVHNYNTLKVKTKANPFNCTEDGKKRLIRYLFCISPKNNQTDGGVWIPVDKLAIVAPYIGLASTILVATIATAIYAKNLKRREMRRTQQ